jgi:hypothetical protein
VSGIQSTITRHTEKQENTIHDGGGGGGGRVEISQSKLTQIPDLEDKDIKAATVTALHMVKVKYKSIEAIFFLEKDPY